MLGHTICATILLEPFTPTSWVTSPARPQDRKMSCGSCSPLELCQCCKQDVESDILDQNTLDWNRIQYIIIYLKKV